MIAPRTLLDPAAAAAAALLLAASLAVGCSPGAAAPDCRPADVLALPDRIEVSEGGRVVLQLRETSPTSLLDGLEPPWRRTDDEEAGRIVYRVPYGATGETKVSLGLRCGAEARTVKEVAIDVRPLRFSVVHDGAADAPEAREHPHVWIDSGDPDRLLLYGGYGFVPAQFTLLADLWSLDLRSGAWERLSDDAAGPRVATARVAPVPGTRDVLLFGGTDEDNDVSSELWRFDGEALSWSIVPTTGFAPTGAVLSSFVLDAGRERWLNVCGASANGYHCLPTTLTLDEAGARWAPLLTDGQEPAGRLGFAHAFDEETRRLVVFSGELGGGAGFAANPAEDTWALDVSGDDARWERLSAGEDPPIGRRNPCWVLDPVGHRLFVWGGTADGATYFRGLFVLDLDRGHERWTRLDVEGATARSSCMGVYDGARRRALFGFGNNEVAIYADVVALDL